MQEKKRHNERYEDMVCKFKEELEEVGVTSGMLRRLQHSLDGESRNLVGTGAVETVAGFLYTHKGYTIRATCEVTVRVSYDTKYE